MSLNTTAAPTNHRPAPPTANQAIKTTAAPKPTLTQRKKRQRYTTSEKALILAECEMRPVDKVSRDFNVGKSLIYRWRQKLRNTRRRVPIRQKPVAAAPRTPPAAKGLAAARASLVRAQADLSQALDQMDRITAAMAAVFGAAP